MTPDRPSCGSSVTVWSVSFQPLGATALVFGAVASMLIAGEAADFVLPALSATVLVTLWLAPSVESTVSAGAGAARPERASAAVHLTVTGPLYQPAALGLLVAAALSVGAVLSTLMPDSVALPWLPATSVAVPVADWFAPSPRTLRGRLTR